MSETDVREPLVDGDELFGEHRPWVTNLVLLVLVAGLGIWVWLGEQETKSSKELSGEKRKVFKFFLPADVVKIKLTRTKNDETIFLTRDASDDPERDDLTAKQALKGPTGWKLMEPVQDDADDSYVLRILTGMQWCMYTTVIEGENLDSYTFGDPLVAAAIQRKTGPVLEFEVGARRGDVYPVRYTGRLKEDRVYHVKAELVDLLLGPTWKFRSRRLIKLEPKQVERVEAVVWSDKEDEEPTIVLLTKGPRHWRVGELDGDYASTRAVEDLTTLGTRLVASRVEKNKPNRAEMTRYGLLPKPKFGLGLFAGKKQEDGHILHVGTFADEKKTERFARMHMRGRLKTVYRINFSGIAPLYDGLSERVLEPRLFPIGNKDLVKRLEAEFKDGPAMALALDKEGTWRFKDQDAIAANLPTEELIEKLLAMKILDRKGGEGDVDEAAVGLEEPELVVRVGTDDYLYEIAVGAQSDPGIYTVRREVPNGPGLEPSRFYYDVKLAEVVPDLREAPRDLLSRGLLKAGFAEALELTDADGKALFSARKVAPPDTVIKQWQVDGVDGIPDLHEKLEAYVTAQLTDLTVLRWVALKKNADLAKYGLDRPRTLTAMVTTFENNKKTLAPKKVLIGRRSETDMLYVTTPDGTAIGEADPVFLEEPLRLVQKAHRLFAIDDVFDVRGLLLRRRGATLLSVTRPRATWIRDASDLGFKRRMIGTRDQREQDDLEDLIETAFEFVEVVEAEPTTEERKRTTGLDDPEWEITFRLKPQTGDEKERIHVLLLGHRVGDDFWAMLLDGDRIGRLSGHKLRVLQRFLEAWPETPFPRAR